jgi:Domain of unknown function (DUF4406)
MNRKVLVYIAGPFRAPSAWGIEQNIRRAEELALEVWRNGFACICPHTNTRFYQGALPDGAWLEGDLTILNRCDALLTCAGWSSSEGAKAEILFADQHAIPCFDSVTSLCEWANDPHAKRRAVIMRYLP